MGSRNAERRVAPAGEPGKGSAAIPDEARARDRRRVGGQDRPVSAEGLDAPLRAFMGYRIKRAYLAVHGEVLQTLSAFDLRVGTFSALLTIVKTPDITQTRLAEALTIDRSGVVLLVDDLEGRDLISRNRVPGDRRSYALRATLKGMRLAEKAAAAVEAAEDGLMATLTDQERAALSALLARIESRG